MNDRGKSDGPVVPAKPLNKPAVVLYVDDLDRCPPHRVAEVLRAVHLLLSFPVFVVVVAVDPRWLSQSLHTEFEDLLDFAAAPQGGAGATPHDYLEKIFQIPFSVAPLGLGERQRLVEGLLGIAPDDVVRAALPVPAGGDASTGTERGAPTERLPVSAGSATEIAPDADGGDRPALELRLTELLAGSGAATVELNPATLEFTSAERTYLTRLLPLLDSSPRGIKRYVNIYRLIKLIAGIEGRDELDTDEDGHECAMFLLAIQTGLPVVGPELVTRLAGEDAGEGQTAAEALAALIDAVAASDAGQRAPAEIAGLRRWLTNQGAAWPIETLTDFARHVRLYSYG